ncbi:FlgB family protein [Falsirhodobacter sp. alg1]|uniref:FlgB family protein n=1 Tax=Falsirhodobacter sp. alg1 TaxID=1472418 RepID=UPI0007889C56|nr:FlgB family protein [Falsirhodobacter sp. alg1]
MFESLPIVKMAQAFAAHAGARQGLVSQNVANADTPGYKARDLAPFAASYEAAGALRTTRAGHIRQAQGGESVIVSSGITDPNGNGVTLESEMVKAAEIRQDHDMALSIYRATANILRTSLGRQ